VRGEPGRTTPFPYRPDRRAARSGALPPG
jgi:hypothetical protein